MISRYLRQALLSSQSVLCLLCLLFVIFNRLLNLAIPVLHDLASLLILNLDSLHILESLFISLMLLQIDNTLIHLPWFLKQVLAGSARGIIRTSDIFIEGWDANWLHFEIACSHYPLLLLQLLQILFRHILLRYFSHLLILLSYCSLLIIMVLYHLHSNQPSGIKLIRCLHSLGVVIIRATHRRQSCQTRH
jgi:hypothetical protein